MDHYWSTQSELNFIKKIDKFINNGTARKRLLQGYLKGTEQRVNWGTIDKNVVISYAQKELNKLMYPKK